MHLVQGSCPRPLSVVLAFPAGRNIPREIADKVSDLATAHSGGPRVTYDKEQLSEVIMVALGTYREACGR